MHDNGYTPIPNTWLDRAIRSKLIPRMIRILFLIMRNTWGWHREWTQMSSADIAKAVNIKDADTVKKIVRRMVKARLIDRVGGKKGVGVTSAPPVPNKYRVHIGLHMRKSTKQRSAALTISWKEFDRAVKLERSFSRFWEVYPNKVNKMGARKSWVRAKVGVNLAKKIVRAADAWAKSDQWTKDNGQYVPHATTWLNNHRWEDEIETKPTERW